MGNDWSDNIPDISSHTVTLLCLFRSFIFYPHSILSLFRLSVAPAVPRGYQKWMGFTAIKSCGHLNIGFTSQYNLFTARQVNIDKYFLYFLHYNEKIIKDQL